MTTQPLTTELLNQARQAAARHAVESGRFMGPVATAEFVAVWMANRCAELMSAEADDALPGDDELPWFLRRQTA